MPRYLYRFGFSTPDQWKANEAHGWDDESSEAFYVVAEDEEAAVAWGRQVSERFHDRLFRAAGWPEPVPSWEESRYAFWIEDEPEQLFSAETLAELPVVEIGEMPPFESWSLD